MSVGASSMEAVQNFVDVGLIRVALTLASEIPTGQPIFSIHSTHAANVCKHILASTFLKPPSQTHASLVQTRKFAANQFAEALASNLLSGGLRSTGLQSVIAFIFMNRSPDVRTLLVDRCLSKALAKAAICFVVDMIRSVNADQSSYFHGMQHFPRVARRVLLIGTSSSTSELFFDLYTTISTPVFKLSRMPSPNLKRCRSISAGVGRDARRFRWTSATRDDPTLSTFFLSKKTLALQPFRKEVGETLLLSNFPNILAHTRRYRWTDLDKTTSMVTSTFCIGTTTSESPKHDLNGMKAVSGTLGGPGVLFRMLSQIFQTAPEAVQTATLSSGKGARQVRVPVDHLRAASTLSAFLCCPSTFDRCQADEGRRFIFFPSKPQGPRNPKRPRLVNLHLLRLRGHMLLLWNTVLCCGFVSLQLIAVTRRLLILLDSFLKDAHCLDYCDFSVVEEVLAYSRFLLASEAQTTRACSFKTLARLHTSEAWMQSAVELTRHACKRMSKPSLVGAVTMLLLGNSRAVSIIFQYMDLILIHGDAIITCLDNLSTDDDTLQPKVKNYYLPLFLLLTFTVKLGVELLNNPKNHDQNTVGLVWHDRDLQQEKLLATFSRLKCFIEPRSGMLAFFWQNNVSSVDHHLQYADCFETPYAVETTTAALTLIFEVMSIPLGPLFCDMNARRAHFHAVFRTFLQGFNYMSKDALSQTSAWKRICGIQLKLIKVICGFRGNLCSLGTRCCIKLCHCPLKCCELFKSTEEALSIQHGCSVANCSYTKESACLSDMLGVVLDFLVNEICLEYEAYDPDNKDWVTSSMCMSSQSTGLSAEETPALLQTKEISCFRAFKNLSNLGDLDRGRAHFPGTQIKLSRKSIRDAHADHTYMEKRKTRRLYLHRGIQRLIIELLLHVLARADHREYSSRGWGPEHGTRERYEMHKQTAFVFLRLHLKQSHNRQALSDLVSSMHLLGRAETRVLRLSCDSLFQWWMYRPQELLARGVHANVHRCSVPIELKIRFRDDAVGKMTPAPATISCAHTTDRVFLEVALLEAMENSPLIAKLLDYGVSGSSYSIIMHRYPASLKHWRASQRYDVAAHNTILPILLHFNIYTLCIDAVCALAEYGVTHFDIKADNFLLEPGPNCSVDDFWDPPEKGQHPLFRVVITDFSESRFSAGTHTMWTSHKNGTEYIKAPEILITCTNNQIINRWRREENQFGQRADVWSLGCLLFEIIANDYM